MATPQIKKLPDLQKRLQEVAEGRGHVYAHKFALIVYWEDDDTNASDDARTMETLLKDVFAFPTCVTFILKKNDRGPGWSLLKEFRKLLEQHHDMTQHSLFVLYYAGHGKIRGDRFCLAGKRSSIVWSMIKGVIFEDHDDEVQNLDVFSILDCCYSGKADRAETNRTTQILAASDDITQKRHVGQISFTQQLHRAIHALRSRCPEAITSASLFDEIKQDCGRKKFKSVLITDGGKKPITLTFRPPRTASPTASPSRIPIRVQHRSKYSVMAKITLHGEITAFSSFAKMIRNLPQNMTAEIVEAYKTDQSFFCLMHMDFESFALWDMVTELQVVDVTIGESLKKMDSHLEETSIKENVPFRSK